MILEYAGPHPERGRGNTQRRSRRNPATSGHAPPPPAPGRRRPSRTGPSATALARRLRGVPPATAPHRGSTPTDRRPAGPRISLHARPSRGVARNLPARLRRPRRAIPRRPPRHRSVRGRHERSRRGGRRDLDSPHRLHHPLEQIAQVRRSGQGQYHAPGLALELEGQWSTGPMKNEGLSPPAERLEQVTKQADGDVVVQRIAARRGSRRPRAPRSRRSREARRPESRFPRPRGTDPRTDQVRSFRSAARAARSRTRSPRSSSKVSRAMILQPARSRSEISWTQSAFKRVRRQPHHLLEGGDTLGELADRRLAQRLHALDPGCMGDLAGVLPVVDQVCTLRPISSISKTPLRP